MVKTYDSVKLYNSGVYLVDGKEIVPDTETEKLSSMVEFAPTKEDAKKGNYNPFSKDYIIEGFDDRVKSMLMMMMAETCREFEKLPIIKYTDILRNILYSGVWCRFETVSGKRKKEQEKEQEKEHV